MKKYSENILAFREQLKLSQPAFGKKFGVSAAAVHKWESGQSRPSYTHAEEMRKFAAERNLILGLEYFLAE